MAKYTCLGQNPLPVAQGGTGTTTSTGTTDLVYATSPTLVTPTLGAATATSITFSPSTDGFIGTTTNDNASSGIVGQVITSQVTAASPTSSTTTAINDVTSISIPAGDWDVEANAGVQSSGGSITSFSAWINTSSATAPDLSNQMTWTTSTAPTSQSAAVPYTRINVSGPVTAYISILPVGTGTLTSYGTITARRAR
jgi:hypothetical protein